MANGTLPSYLTSAQPTPAESRGPWYTNTAPAYFGIFMWIAFYDKLGGVLEFGGIGAALIGLVLAGLISHYLFHYVFGLLGMRTGFPLYVVGSSTFGTSGGLLFPGIFMGLLQIGWYSVGTYYATKLMLGGLGIQSQAILAPVEDGQGFQWLFIIVAIAWGYIFATFGAFGIKYVAMVSTYLPWIALLMLVVAAGSAAPYISDFKVPAESPSALIAVCLMIQLVIGFFATAGAAGADFGTASRNGSDVNKAGLVGVALPCIVAGGLAVLIVAGANGMDTKAPVAVVAEDTTAVVPVTDTQAVVVEDTDVAVVETPEPARKYVWSVAGCIPKVSPSLGNYMLILLAIGSMAPACFCSSIIGNSLSTMIPSLPRVPLTLAGATVGIALAALGVAGNLVPFFGLIGASFGPICGAMVADYLLSGGKWPGPRKGVNIAGYAAWVIGFIVGIINNPLVGVIPGWHPTAVYSFVVGFVVFAVLAKAGLQGPVVELPQRKDLESAQ